jgi:hypothetical protein
MMSRNHCVGLSKTMYCASGCDLSRPAVKKNSICRKIYIEGRGGREREREKAREKRD